MQKTKRPRNRIATVLLFPITIFVWIVAWPLFWTGSKKQQLQKKHTKIKDDGIRITTVVTDEIEEYNMTSAR